MISTGTELSKLLFHYGPTRGNVKCHEDSSTRSLMMATIKWAW